MISSSGMRISCSSIMYELCMKHACISLAHAVYNHNAYHYCWKNSVLFFTCCQIHHCCPLKSLLIAFIIHAQIYTCMRACIIIPSQLSIPSSLGNSSLHVQSLLSMFTMLRNSFHYDNDYCQYHCHLQPLQHLQKLADFTEQGSSLPS